jgi:hypothetical protein
MSPRDGISRQTASGRKLQQLTDEAMELPEVESMRCLGQRLTETESEIAKCEQELVDWGDQLALTLESGDSKDSELGVVRTEQTLRGLKARLAAIVKARSDAYGVALRAFESWKSSKSEEQMRVTKLPYDAAVEEFERIVSPALDGLLAAARNYDDAGKGLPDAERILGTPPAVTLDQSQALHRGEGNRIGNVPILSGGCQGFYRQQQAGKD